MRKRKLRRGAKVVKIGDEMLSLRDAAKASGLSYFCLRDRYLYAKDSAEDLLRPSGARKQKVIAPVKLKVRRDLGANHYITRIVDTAKADAYREALARAKAEHAAAFSAPLISQDLLTPAEGPKIKCVRRSWYEVEPA